MKKAGKMGKYTCSALPSREHNPRMGHTWRYEKSLPDAIGKLFKSTDYKCSKSHVSGKACVPKIPLQGKLYRMGQPTLKN
jgi:hypothetical protein